MVVGGFAGRVRRDEFTGNVYMSEYLRACDFAVVDTFNRQFPIEGRPEELAQDPYLFKVAAMPFRSWIFDEKCRAATEQSDVDEIRKDEQFLSALRTRWVIETI